MYEDDDILEPLLRLILLMISVGLSLSGAVGDDPDYERRIAGVSGIVLYWVFYLASLVNRHVDTK